MENIRFLFHSLRASSPRAVYWELAKRRERRAQLKKPEHAAFANHVAAEAERLAVSLTDDPTRADDDVRLAAAVAWLLRAQRATPDAGVSLGYFPLDVDGGWKESYPETTGYLITSLLAFAALYSRKHVEDMALAMANWEIDVQMPSGAVQGGPVAPRDQQTPAAFNTGMVLDGWCSAYEATRQRRFLDAATAAANFLRTDIDDDGYFKTSGKFVSRGETKTYNCLCAWAMLRLARLTGDAALEHAAIGVVEAAVKRQRKNGWFPNNCLTLSSIPLTHTIGYTLQGIFEVGVLAERPDLIAAAELGLRGVLGKQRPNGFLSARFDEQWRPAASYACLTGSCQLAVVAYRFARLFGAADLMLQADRMVSFVKATQLLEGDDPNIVGAIAGSFPILGNYMSAGYPNWATKYFIDALLARNALRAAAPSILA